MSFPSAGIAAPKPRPHATATHGAGAHRVSRLIEQVSKAPDIAALAVIRRAIRHALATGQLPELLPQAVRKLTEALHDRVLALARSVATGPELCKVYNYTLAWHLSPAARERLERIMGDRMPGLPNALVAKGARLPEPTVSERIARYCADSPVLARTDAHRPACPALAVAA